MLLSLAVPTLAVSDVSPKFTRPSVLVLVLGGFGAYDQVSINYTGAVALPTAQADLDTSASIGKWRALNARGETKSSGGPNPTPTTSISFQAKGIIGYSNGTLPLEPFVTALKRFKFIEVDYIVPNGFSFRGLEDFENAYVKIQLSPTGNSYRYRVVVKDTGFTKLGFPLLQPTKPKQAPKTGMPLGARLALGIGLGLLGGAAVYLLTTYIMKRKTT